MPCSPTSNDAYTDAMRAHDSLLCRLPKRVSASGVGATPGGPAPATPQVAGMGDALHALPSGYDPLFSDMNQASNSNAQGEGASGETKPERKVKNAKNRIDHLGIPLKAMSRQRYKYSRTFTIMYDAEKEKDIMIEKQYRLLQDSKKVLDMSISGLRRLFRIFYHSVQNVEQSLVGQRHFRLALAKHGVRDVILMQRLFTEFCSPVDRTRIDYRQFVRILTSVNEESVEEKLALLFEVWDIDQSGTLSYSELSPVVLLGAPSGDMEALMDKFNKVWADIRNFLNESNEEWIGASRNGGVSNDDLVNACERLPAVCEFFDKILTRSPPKADDKTDYTRSFQLRLRELEAEVQKEIAKEKELDQKRAESRSPSPTRQEAIEIPFSRSPTRSPMRTRSNSVPGFGREDSMSSPTRRRHSVAGGPPSPSGSPKTPKLRTSKSFQALGKNDKNLVISTKERANNAMRSQIGGPSDSPSPSKAVKLPPVGNGRKVSF